MTVIESPESARQLETLVQLAIGFESVSVAVPPPLTAAATVYVVAKLAVSVSVFAALNVQGTVVPLQVPPDQPVKRAPELAAALIEIGSPTLATQWDW